jgi:delta14-sterol reductase
MLLCLIALCRSPFAGHTVRSFADQYLLSLHAVLLYLGWFALHVALYFILPGEVVDGVALDSKGTKLKYPLNGLAAMAVSVAVVVGISYLQPQIIPPTFAYDQFTQLAFTTTVFSFLLAIYLYAASLFSSREGGRYLTSETQLAHHGNTRNRLYDFFIGRSLNPRVAGGVLDLKYFCELRPGLILWFLINLSMAAKQYQKHGEVTASMWLVIAFQAYYVYDALSSERAILTTMDITTDGFGWMLAFGDLAWVPFTYTTQARFLVDHPAELAYLSIAGILAVKALGFWIFRGSNGQKNDFRTDPNGPNVKHLKYIETKSGSKLLISGWWGIARHMNYLGDLLMALSWCLPCGVQSAVPYFYFVYFTGLLLHRERRDEAKCKAKYKGDWDRYTMIVKSRILPYVY